MTFLNNNPTKSGTALEQWRLYAFLGFVGLIFLIFALRLFYLQVLEHENWLSQAEENRTEVISLPPQRGVIYDRNGVVLARNEASYNIVVVPAELPEDDGEIEKILYALADLTEQPMHLGSIDDPLIPCGTNLGVAEMVAIQTSFSPYDPVSIQCNVSRELALAVMEHSVDWPGVDVVIEPVREYPTGSITAAIIGYLGPIPAAQEEELRAQGFVPNRDKVGYGGLELYFDELLRGTPGRRVVETDAGGQILRDIEPPVDAVAGQNIVLTIDARLQAAASAIIEEELQLWNNFFADKEASKMTSGVIIAINPKTGELLAMVSWPTFENNRMTRFIPAYYYEQLLADATKPLVNHAAGAALPAGSVFKIVTAVGGLNEGIVTPEEIVQTPGSITVSQRFYEGEAGQNREFVDWNRAGFGQLNFYGGIANSSNVYFYKVGGGYEGEIDEGLGICRLGTYARAMGYGEALGVELPYEVDGLVPDPTWKRLNQGENWSTGDTYISSVGQGYVLASPLQVLISTATIANDGAQMRPTLLRQIVDGEGNIIQDFEPDLRWDITKDPIIEHYENPSGIGACRPTGELTTVDPAVIQAVQRGMREAVTYGTLAERFRSLTIAAAGKTGTAEYCDEVAAANNRCQYGAWPSHAWSVAYAPFDDPELAVVAFVYNGSEGSSVAGPILNRVIQAYFELKSIDTQLGRAE
ncbi:MAG: penicillin-binding protein 2 [Anaerolineales bacterium]|nr:penicillin-binding protein 2 [Anaerolineales bacterium]MCW5887825.1 penicillin-binding protein 2 [Anaerolineales bacterium]